MKILIFTINPVHNAPRVIREINALINDYDIVVTGSTAPTDKAITYINSDSIKLSHVEYTLGKIYRVLTLGSVYKGRYWTTQRKIKKLLKDTQPDVVIVHPGAFLPYFFVKNRSFKIVFNAHEYHPNEFDGNQKWKKTWGKIYHHIYKKYLPQVDLLINVCDGIAKECRTQYGVNSLVFPNAGPYVEAIQPSLKTSGKIRMIHHGVAIPERNLELMIELTQLLGDRFELDMMLVYESDEYFKKLKNLAAKSTNVRLIPPVQFHEIVPLISQYDIGLFLLPPINFNYLHALPNKFFEFVQARLAIAVGPSPEMKVLVEKFELGLVSKDFSVDAMVEKLQSITHEELNKFKISSDKAAKELNQQTFESAFLSSFKEILN